MVKNSAALLFFHFRSYIYLTSSLSTFSVGLSQRPAFGEQVISGWRSKTETTHFLIEENASSKRLASAFASRLFRLGIRIRDRKTIWIYFCSTPLSHSMGKSTGNQPIKNNVADKARFDFSRNMPHRKRKWYIT